MLIALLVLIFSVSSGAQSTVHVNDDNKLWMSHSSSSDTKKEEPATFWFPAFHKKKESQVERDCTHTTAEYSWMVSKPTQDEDEDDEGIEAFVTSIKSQKDILDACVLARSLKAHFGNSRDLVAIVKGPQRAAEKKHDHNASLHNWKYLQRCGWDVLQFHLPFNKYIVQNARLEWLRIHAWTLTEYKAVIYIEPNSLVISSSVEELFRCGCFCSPIYKGDYFDPDVMGLRPDSSVYAHMLTTIEENTLGKRPELIPWFNTYFRDLVMRPYFPLKVPAETVRCIDCSVQYFSFCMRRLPVGYNADPIFHGIFLNSRLLRYKSSSLKPYQWWSAVLLSYQARHLYLHYMEQSKAFVLLRCRSSENLQVPVGLHQVTVYSGFFRLSSF
eukprot:jgi/Galph1/3320/GphlegSOOS_G1976.1